VSLRLLYLIFIRLGGWDRVSDLPGMTKDVSPTNTLILFTGIKADQQQVEAVI
jgi:hypothetical protein